MKKTQGLMAGIVGMLAIGAAHALPITDVYTPASPVTLSNTSPYSYTHSLLAYGFDPAADTLAGATLDLDISGPGGQTLTVVFDLSQVFRGSLNTWLNNEPFALDLSYLQNDGLLNVTLQKSGGGGSTFRFGKSTLTAVGEKADTDVAQIPEPASLALLGIGLAGLGALRRRKVR